METADHIRALLRKAVETAGSQKLWAQLAGLSPQYVCDVLAGRREPGGSIAHKLGYEPVTMYRRKNTAQTAPGDK